MESSRVMCPHCDGWFSPEEGVSLDDCPVCGRTVEVKPAPAPGATCKESLQVHALPESVGSALGVVALSDFPSVESVLRHHISDLTRRLADAEAENGRFAEMLESSVSDWRKLYAEERAERVRIQGILLNDVQAEHQESDEHIKGLDAVIKTQDKTIRDLKSRVAEAEAERDALRERCEKLEWLREVEDWRPPTTHHNDGNGSGKRWFNSCQEYSATLQAALATEVKP